MAVCTRFLISRDHVIGHFVIFVRKLVRNENKRDGLHQYARRTSKINFKLNMAAIMAMQNTEMIFFLDPT